MHADAIRNLQSGAFGKKPALEFVEVVLTALMRGKRAFDDLRRYRQSLRFAIAATKTPPIMKPVVSPAVLTIASSRLAERPGI